MNALPIIERELRVRARNGGTYWTRFAVALLGLLACLPLLGEGGPSGSPAAIGKYVFDGLSSAAFLLSCSACLLTADAISAERREGTLGLLLLTRVRSLDVLLGKLGSVGFSGLCALVAFLPVLLLPVLAGGVTGGEALRKGLVLLDTLFLALAAGLFASASRQERAKALGLASGLMALLVFGPMLLRFSLWPPGGFSPGMLNPLSCFLAAADAPYKSAPGSYWISLGAVQAFAWLLLGAAAWRFRRSLRQPAPVELVAAPEPGAGEEAPLRPRRWPVGAEANPVECLVRRQRGLKAVLWAAALLAMLQQAMWALFPPLFGRVGFRPSWLMALQLPGVALSAVDGALFVWAASRFFLEARRSGELELLRTTPAGAQTLVSGQWAALRSLLLHGPLPVMLLPALLRVTIYPLSLRGTGVSSLLLPYFVSALVSLVSIVVSVKALCWLGLWFGYHARGQFRAIAWTVALAKGVPFLLSYLGAPLFHLLIRPFVSGLFGGSALYGSVVYLTVSFLPQLLILFVLVWLIREARRRLLRELAPGEATRLSWRQSLAEAIRGAVNALRNARHWTPS